MKKELIVQVRSTPVSDVIYGDTIILCNTSIQFACPMSSCPNPYKPFRPKEHWSLWYAWIASGTYTWKCIKHWRRGKILIINNRDWVDTRSINVKHGKSAMKQCLVHKGWSKNWRGSAGCLTFPPLIWPGFISMFEVGDEGLFHVRDY